jgi:hypothetical protein
MYHLPDPSSATTTPGFKSRTKTNSLDSSQSKHNSVDLKLPSPDLSPFLLGPFHHNTPHTNSLFNATVLELVKLVQAALAIFGMFPISHIGSHIQFEADGLLCDLTVNGIQRWVTEIGEPCVGVEVCHLGPTCPLFNFNYFLEANGEGRRSNRRFCPS